MKKIIMGIVAATLATSVFAADVSAKVKLTGDLANFDGKNFTAVKINNHVSHNWEPDMALSVSSDNAGATVKFKTLNEWGSGEGETSTAWNIWFKAFDLVKLDVGIFDGNVNQEQIDWSNTKSNYGGNGGYRVGASIAGINVDLSLLPGMGNAWVQTSGVNGKARLADTVLTAAYSFDYGKIGALFEYKGNNKVTTTVLTGDETYALDPATGLIKATQKTATKDLYDYNYMKFALGWNSNSLFSDIMGLNVFVNVIGAVNSKGLDVGTADYNGGFSGLRAEIWAKMSMDAFSVALFPALNVSFVKADTQKVGVFTLLKASYGLSNGLGAYVYVKAADWLDIPTNGVIIRPGVTGSVGICGWEVKVEMTVGKKAAPFTVAVPVEFTVNF